MTAPAQLTILALAGIFLPACAAHPDAERTGPAPEKILGTVEGITADSSQRLIFRSREGETIELKGELFQELGRLAGAEVEVLGVLMRGDATRPGRGSNGGSAEEATLEAQNYNILSMNGSPVLVGTLTADDSGRPVLMLGDGERVALLGAEELVHDRLGAKVWVEGQRENGNLVVESMGLIVDPPTPPIP